MAQPGGAWSTRGAAPGGSAAHRGRALQLRCHRRRTAPWLGDVFAVPASMPLANVFSIGDIIMAAAAAYAVHRVCGTRLVRRRTTAAAAEPAAAASHSGPSPGSSW
ncbi:MAG TPA: DUF5317 family protein [Mycobacteriales bacterium]|nr:DUF5317 family protein [Mycobacteriales bacterium]